VTRFEAWSLHASNALVGGTGLVYAWMRYVAEPADEFAVVNHPWQSDVQHLHIWFAPLLVFGSGLIFQRHVLARLRTGFPHRRPTGWLLTLNLVPMTASGYLLQTSASEAWRTTWVVVHLVTSALWILGYLAHLISRRPARAAVAEMEARATTLRGAPRA
jgi:hypothetical protein